MPDLILHDRRLDSVFELLGAKENDITYSLGWALSRCEPFLAALVADVFPGGRAKTAESVLLQKHAEDGGYTDIELCGPNLHCIIEAKRAWTLPSDGQLGRFASRIDKAIGSRALLVLSGCSETYARLHAPETVNGVTLLHRSWSQVDSLAERAYPSASHSGKRLLLELRTYLRSLMTMHNHTSNLVYVVSLGAGTPKGSRVSWIDMVVEKKHYFHYFGIKGWPSEPPNYLGFRYRGRLQSVHHVERYEVVTDLHEHIPEIEWKTSDHPLILYWLGPPIRPAHEVRTGKIYPIGRVWAMIDTLLTCKTISEARDLTRERRKTTS